MRKGFGIARGQRRGPARIAAFGQRRLDRVGPAAQHGLEFGVERGRVGIAGAAAEIEHVTQHREVAAFDLQAPVERLGSGRSLEQVFDALPHSGRQHVARQPDEREQVALERRHDQGQARARAVGKRHHRRRHAREVAFREADHQVVRQHRQRVDQRLGVVAAALELELAADLGEMAPQHRHLLGRSGERGAGPDPGMDRERRGFAVLDQRHHEQVERYAAMDARKPVGLDHQRRASALVEPREGALVSLVRRQLARALAADPEQLHLAAVTAARHVSELRQHSAAEPAQQLGTFGIGHAAGILGDEVAHLRPVGHRGADIGERGGELLLERAAHFRVGPLGLEVD